MRELSEVQTSDAPLAIGPYSQAIVSGDMVFCSGQIGLNPENGKLAEGVEAQTGQIIANLGAILDAAGSSINHVLKTTVFLVSMADFKAMNQVYGEYFVQPFPARATVEVRALPLGALVEIEAIAILEYGR